MAYRRAAIFVSLVILLVWIALPLGAIAAEDHPHAASFAHFWAASDLALAGEPAAAYTLATHASLEGRLFPQAEPGYSAWFSPALFLLTCLVAAAFASSFAIAASTESGAASAWPRTLLRRAPRPPWL